MSRSIRNCSVAVVGGAGFLGSHLVNHLIEDRHCKVLVIDNLITGHREFVHPDATFEHHDITKSEAYTYQLLKRYKVHYVLNYSAEPYVPVSFARPLHVFDINAMGALWVINAAQDAKVEAILQVSSAEIYGVGAVRSEDPQKISESDSVIPHSSYGAAKAAIDALVQVRWREAKTPCIALRQFNCVGERETHPYVIPEIIGQLFRSKDGVVRLGNNSFRDFLYAGDAVRMAVELLEGGKFGEVYNLGSESGIKIYDLAQRIGTLIGHGKVTVVEDLERVRPWEIWHLQSDNSKIYSVIKHRPTVKLDEALQRTIDWYAENGKRWPWEK